MHLTEFKDYGKYAVFNITNTTVNDVAKRVNEIFLLSGYKLEKGTPVNGIYGIGSNIMRILFGAFVKRFTFTIIISEKEDCIKFEFLKAMSGASGGIIGHDKMTKEYFRVAYLLKDQISKS